MHNKRYLARKIHLVTSVVAEMMDNADLEMATVQAVSASVLATQRRNVESMPRLERPSVGNLYCWRTAGPMRT